MYDAINRRDVEAALAFVDDDILYEDFNFPVPFKGKERVRKLAHPRVHVDMGRHFEAGRE